MSLLMDALKKAEEAKRKEKAAAEGADTSSEDKASEESSPLEDYASETEKSPQDTAEAIVEQQPAEQESESPFKLRLEDEEDDQPEIAHDQPTSTLPEFVVEEDGASEDANKDPDIVEAPRETITPSHDVETDPSAMTLQMDIPDFEAIRAMEVKKDQEQAKAEISSIPPVDEAQQHQQEATLEAIEDLFVDDSTPGDQSDASISSQTGVIQPEREQPPIDYEALMALKADNQERAKKLFKAKQPKQRNTLIVPIILGSVIVIILLAGIAGYYWLTEGLDSQSTFITPPPHETGTYESPVTSGTPTVDIADTSAGDAAIAVSDDMPAATTGAGDPAGQQTTTGEMLPEAQSIEVTQIEATVEPTTPIETAPDDQPVLSIGEALPTEDLSTETPGSYIKIRKGSSAARLDKRLKQAWQAYQAGDIGKAGGLYSGVLKAQPNNRNALLGKAAIAVQNNNLSEARSYYLRLLERNPRDPVAQAGLIAMISQNDPVAGISRINQLLEEHPKIDVLHFTLGNLYAQQSRWIEAQQAYFRAWTLDRGNPDYSYNIAIALDHLGKDEQARRFYQQSLDLATERGASFSSQNIKQRIRELDAFANSN